MALNIKTKDGKSGEFNASEFLKANVPGATVSDYDPENGVLKFKAGDKSGEFNIKQMLADQGVEVTGVGELNSPVEAADNSPLSWKERWELGYLTRESSDFQRLVDGIGQVFGRTPTASDAALEVNEKRAIAQLKKRYDDAKVANGELVVKQNGVWKKVDSSSDSLGEDAAQLLGSAGLNIMGAIAGGTLGATAGTAVAPGPGTAIGGAIGAIAGSMVGEVAEEATAIGIVGGEVDPKGVARDLMTEGIMALAGETIGGLAARGAQKLTGQSMQEAAESAAIQKEVKVLKGMQKVADTADSGVKDTIAKLYAGANENISEAPLREAIDSSENMKEAYRWSKVHRNIKPDSPDTVVSSMAEEFQTTLDRAFSTVQAEFGAVVNKIKGSVTDDFTIDLEQRLVDLKAAAEEAPRDKRAFFDVIQNETADLLKKMKAGGEGVVIRGKQAFDFSQRQYEIINNKLKAIGAYDEQLMAVDDRLLVKSLHKTRSYLDSERLLAAEHSGFNEAFSAIKNKYGKVKDALDVVWSKSFSNKRDLTFAQNVAKGNVDQNITQALNIVDAELPQAGLKKTLSSMRLKQAGIEMTPIFRVNSLTSAAGTVRGAAAVGATAAAGPVGGAIVGSATLSPRAAALQARGLAKASDAITKNALVKALPQARAQARALMGLAYTAGFARTLGHVEARSLLQNPELFNQFVAQSSKFSQDLAQTSPEAMTEAAIRKVQADAQRVGIPGK